MEGNRRKFSSSGVNGMVKRTQLLQELADFNLVRSLLPLWTDWGVEDTGISIHSMGLSYLAHAGQELGFCTVTEIPAPRRGHFQYITADVRSDGAWFDRETQRVELLAEFERFAGKPRDLASKVENLLLAQHRWKNPQSILLMSYWTEGLVDLPEHAALRSIVNQGYVTQFREEVAGSSASRLGFLQFIMQRGKDNLLRLSQIVVRGES